MEEGQTPTCQMAFAKTILLFILALSSTSVLGTPVQGKELAKRGAVLTSQWATESEVGQLATFVIIIPTDDPWLFFNRQMGKLQL